MLLIEIGKLPVELHAKLLRVLSVPDTGLRENAGTR
jgi:transcriptional regulator with GAF, ATPase, and Fis domain